MGRGRQKAKHTKLARELKSYSPDLNYNALERELSHSSPTSKWDEYEDDDKYTDTYGTEDEAKRA